MKRALIYLALYMTVVAIVAGILSAVATDHWLDSSNTHITYVTKPKVGPPVHATSKPGTSSFPVTLWNKYRVRHNLTPIPYQGWKSIAVWWQGQLTSPTSSPCGTIVRQSGYTTYFTKCKVVQTFHVTHLVSPVPTPQPQPTPTPQPTNNYSSQCQSANTNCELALLQLINQERSSHNIAPLQINWTESNSTSSCVGAKGHSIHMSQSGILAHDQFPADICVPFTSAGENIGEAGGNEWQAIQQINNLMLQEPWSPGCSDNHHCNINSPLYQSVGIGFAYGSGAWWLTTDFVGR